MTPGDAGHASPERSRFALVESLFHEALAQPAECDLSHWLDAQTSDTSIRAEVWSLLEEFERLRGVAATPPTLPLGEAIVLA